LSEKQSETNLHGEPEESPNYRGILIFLCLVFIVGIPLGNYFSLQIQIRKEKIIAVQGLLQIPNAILRFQKINKTWPRSLGDLVPIYVQGIPGYDFHPRAFKNFTQVLIEKADDGQAFPKISFSENQGTRGCQIVYNRKRDRWVKLGLAPGCVPNLDYLSQGPSNSNSPVLPRY
jgi:hypothetical protein